MRLVGGAGRGGRGDVRRERNQGRQQDKGREKSTHYLAPVVDRAL
jgi:hypothetical protein